MTYFSKFTFNPRAGSTCTLIAESPDWDSVLSVFPGYRNRRSYPPINASWYLRWLEQQVLHLPAGVVQLLSGKEGLEIRTPQKSEQRLNSPSGEGMRPYGLGEAFLETARYLRMNPGSSIDALTQHLMATISLSTQQSKDALTIISVRNLAFALLGWQTMLYTPAFGVAPNDQFAIADTLEGYTAGHAILSLRQPHDTARREIPLFLKGFGLLMAPRGMHCWTGEEGTEEEGDKISVLGPKEFNVAFLKQFVGLRVKWVDTIAAHMELDSDTKTLFLYRFPSFCCWNIPQTCVVCACGGDGDTQENGMAAESVLQSCADFTRSDVNWMRENEVNDFLREVLLSYRLLFGQHKVSRKLFRDKERRRVTAENAYDTFDPLLDTLCGRKICAEPLLTEREIYRLSRDFPFLKSRLVVLGRELAIKKPRSWVELWRDRRDTSSWYTFWAIILIGGLGLVFAATQTALAAAQLASAG